MKKYLILLFTALSFSLVSCDEDTEPGGTSVEKMAGDWWVTVNVIDNGQEHVDPYELGQLRMATYNTAANLSTEMWIDDKKHFWDYKAKVTVDYNARTFSSNDFVDNISYESKIRVTNGKILEGVATTPSGMPADSIVYFIEFDDDDNGYLYKVSGFRRTGFPADDF
jgi:hypothetical protein